MGYGPIPPLLECPIDNSLLISDRTSEADCSNARSARSIRLLGLVDIFSIDSQL